MRLSGLVVASILLVPPALFAQHSSASSSSSSSTSSSASSHSGGSSGGSSGGASHASSSAGASHNSSSGSSSAAGRATGGHASAGGGSANPHSPASGSPNSTDTTRTIHEPAINRSPTKEKDSSATKTTQPEKKGFLSFLRHPFHKPEPKHKPKPKPEPEPIPVVPDLRAVCKHKPCAVCPPGQSAGKNGTCVTPSPTLASARCRAGMVWDGAACASTTDDCAMFSSRAATLANELRGIKGEMQMACSNDPSARQCGELTLSHDGAISRYRMLLNEAPATCRSLLPDLSSL